MMKPSRRSVFHQLGSILQVEITDRFYLLTPLLPALLAHPPDQLPFLLEIVIEISAHQSIDEGPAIHVLEYVLFLNQFEH